MIDLEIVYDQDLYFQQPNPLDENKKFYQNFHSFWKQLVSSCSHSFQNVKLLPISEYYFFDVGNLKSTPPHPFLEPNLSQTEILHLATDNKSICEYFWEEKYLRKCPYMSLPANTCVRIHFQIQPSSSITLFNVYHVWREKKAEKYTFQPLFRRRNRRVHKFSLFIYASTKNHKIQLTTLNRIQNSVTTFQSPFDWLKKNA